MLNSTIVNPNEIIDQFQLISCFRNSAVTLYDCAMNEIEQIKKNPLGRLTPEYWNQQILIAVYLARHAFELSLKELLSAWEIELDKKPSHNIMRLNQIVTNKKLLSDESSLIILEAIEVLDKLHLAEDEQLIRYYERNENKKIVKLLRELASVQDGDIHKLFDANNLLFQAILEPAQFKLINPLLFMQITKSIKTTTGD